MPNLKANCLKLLYIIIFNKKRAGDTHNLLLEFYVEGLKTFEPNENITENLTDKEVFNPKTDKD